MSITEQPIYSYTENDTSNDYTKYDKTSKIINTDINQHKCMCENILTCNSTNSRCYVNFSEFLDGFCVGDGINNRSECCSFICFPVVLVRQILLCLPCTTYNVCRNKCANNKEDKSYLC